MLTETKLQAQCVMTMDKKYTSGREAIRCFTRKADLTYDKETILAKIMEKLGVEVL